MSTDESGAEDSQYGPATVTCPYCLGDVEVDAGPTRLCEVDHCGEGWVIVDLVEGTAGKSSTDSGDLVTDGGVESGNAIPREGTRLDVDDRYHCKWCGTELPELMVDGPIAGEGTEFPAVELCGTCKAKQFQRARFLETGRGPRV